MADPFLAEIRIFGFNFAPTGWAQCYGQIMPLAQNTGLFSLLGNVYGGDGQKTFALPNLAGRCAIHSGQGPGLSQYVPGQTGGSADVALLPSELPAHAHTMMASAQPANSPSAGTSRALASTSPGPGYQSDASQNLTQMNGNALGITGSSFPHENRQPSLVMNFCIATQGIFPSRPQA